MVRQSVGKVWEKDSCRSLSHLLYRNHSYLRLRILDSLATPQRWLARATSPAPNAPQADSFFYIRYRHVTFGASRTSSCIDAAIMMFIYGLPSLYFFHKESFVYKSQFNPAKFLGFLCFWGLWSCCNVFVMAQHQNKTKDPRTAHRFRRVLHGVLQDAVDSSCGECCQSRKIRDQSHPIFR